LQRFAQKQTFKNKSGGMPETAGKRDASLAADTFCVCCWAFLFCPELILLLEVAREVLRKGGDSMLIKLSPLTLLVLEVTAVMKYESGKAEKPSPATS
jgi:hypothetical protein